MTRFFFVLALLLVPATASADARSDLDAAFAVGLDEHPELYAAVAEAQPRRTRAGTLRFFADADVADPAAVPAIAHRLVHGDDDDDVRRALAEQLLRVDVAWDGLRLDLLATDRSPAVRAMMAASLRFMAPESARAGLEAALVDAAPAVRREAAAVVSRRPDAHALAPLLVPALSDPSADVRLAAVRGLDAVAPAVVAAPVVEALLADVDPRVARAARRLVE